MTFYCVPDTVSGAGHTGVNKTDKISVSFRLRGWIGPESTILGFVGDIVLLTSSTVVWKQT